MLAILILAVDDLGRAVAFYRRAFGFVPTVEAPVYVELATGDGPGATALGLYFREGYARNVGETPGRVAGVSPTELYFRVPDLDATVARLRDAGARELSAAADRPWGERVAYFADPDANVVAVAQAR